MSVENFQQREKMTSLFQRHGFDLREASIIQPIAPFIHLSGETIREQLVILRDDAAEPACLRPEFTIPAAQLYAEQGGETPSSYAFLGPVFRREEKERTEFWQADVESFAREDCEAADADLMAFAFDVQAMFFAEGGVIELGDVGLFSSLLDTLRLPRRLAYHLRRNAPTFFDDFPVPSPSAPYNGVLEALRGIDPQEAVAFVRELLSVTLPQGVKGRSAEEIAMRFLEKAAHEKDENVTVTQKEILGRFQEISGHPDDVVAKLRGLDKEFSLSLEADIDRMERRNGFMAARGVDLSQLRASMAFRRNLDYYTGLVFELRSKKEDVLIAGGRYDTMLRKLGFPRDVSAVGCAVWLEFLES